MVSTRRARTPSREVSNVPAQSPSPRDKQIVRAEEDETDFHQFEPWFMPPRQFINPIIGLTPRMAVSLILNGQYGYKADQQWTYAAVERREPVLRAIKERRLSATKRLKWVIRTRDLAHDGGKKQKLTPQQQAEVELQTDALKQVYSKIDNLTEAIGHLSLATFRGYAHCEKHVDGEGWIVKLEPVPQWYWAQCYPVRDWLFNVQALNMNAGASIDPDAWVIREVEDPLDEIGIFVFLRKNLSKKAWDLFTELFAVPSIFTQFQKETARPSDMAAALDVINKVISAGRGALPPGVELTSTAKLVGGESHPFRPHLDYNDQELVIAGTGGKLTMLSEATGIGSGATGAHEQVWNEIAEAEGEEICAVLRQQIDKPELARRGFPQPMVEFALETLKPEDKLKNAETLGAISAAGYRTTDEQASEMLEMEVTSVMGGPGGGGDMFGGGEPGLDQEQEDEDGPPPREDGASVAEGGEQGDEAEPAQNRVPAGGTPGNTYHDAPISSPPAAPGYEAERLHPGRQEQAERLDMITRPYTPQGPTSSAAEPDPMPATGVYPTERAQDQYLDVMRKAVRKYQRSFARGVSKDLGPLREKVKAILALDNPKEVAEKLNVLQNELPTFLKASKAASAIEKALRESLRRGAAVKV